MSNNQEQVREVRTMIFEDKLSDLLDIDGLCKYFNISSKTAYELVRQRDFPSLKVGGQYRVIKNDLAKWMDRQSKKANVR